MIELLLLFFFGLAVEPEIQTVYNFDIYSGEKVAPSALTQKILDNRKKSTTDYTGHKVRPDFYLVTELPIFFKDFNIIYYSYDSVYGYTAEYEFNPFRNTYIAPYLSYR